MIPSDRIGPAEPVRPDRCEIAFSRVFQPGCIEVLPEGLDKPAIVRLLVNRLADNGWLAREHVEETIRTILERESYGATAYRNACAFPHQRTSHVTQFVGGIGCSPTGVDFGAPDYRLTNLIFLTLSPLEERARHCELLSNLFSLTYDKALTLKIRSAWDPNDLYRHLCRLDAALGGGSEAGCGNDSTPRTEQCAERASK